LTSKRRAIRRSLTTGFRNVDDDDAVTAGVVWSVASGAQFAAGDDDIETRASQLSGKLERP
jgi:hypothetical protein